MSGDIGYDRNVEGWAYEIFESQYFLPIFLSYIELASIFALILYLN